MRTVHFPAMRASMTAKYQYRLGGWGGGGYPQVNKFEQASSDGHQMSVVGVAMFDPGLGLYSEDQ